VPKQNPLLPSPDTAAVSAAVLSGRSGVSSLSSFHLSVALVSTTAGAWSYSQSLDDRLYFCYFTPVTVNTTTFNAARNL